MFSDVDITYFSIILLISYIISLLIVYVPIIILAIILRKKLKLKIPLFWYVLIVTFLSYFIFLSLDAKILSYVVKIWGL